MAHSEGENDAGVPQGFPQTVPNRFSEEPFSFWSALNGSLLSEGFVSVSISNSGRTMLYNLTWLGPFNEACFEETVNQV